MESHPWSSQEHLMGALPIWRTFRNEEKTTVDSDEALREDIQQEECQKVDGTYGNKPWEPKIGDEGIPDQRVLTPVLRFQELHSTLRSGLGQRIGVGSKRRGRMIPNAPPSAFSSQEAGTIPIFSSELTGSAATIDPHSTATGATTIILAPHVNQVQDPDDHSSLRLWENGQINMLKPKRNDSRNEESSHPVKRRRLNPLLGKRKRCDKHDAETLRPSKRR
ncbi:hypothetical protein F5Y04DRAFT_286569 [Hypomontagnella monticulosa]|nr:hypothetical protein F5Y04DRAFT_286569 [Hypomontagnella monticulosa]